MIDRTELRNAYRQTFMSPAGRVVLGDLMAFGHVLDQCHMPGAPDQTAFQEGCRRTVLRILGLSGLRTDMIAAVADVPEKPQEADDGSEDES